jgi:hypothetical protein
MILKVENPQMNFNNFRRPEKLHNLFEFIVHSFVDTQPSKGSPLFVDEALRQLAFYYKTEPTKINVSFY